MSIKRWISGAAVALAGVGLLGALGAGQLEDLSLDRVTVGGKIPGAEVLNDLVGTTPSPAGDRQAGAAPAAGRPGPACSRRPPPARPAPSALDHHPTRHAPLARPSRRPRTTSRAG